MWAGKGNGQLRAACQNLRKLRRRLHEEFVCLEWYDQDVSLRDARVSQGFNGGHVDGHYCVYTVIVTGDAVTQSEGIICLVCARQKKSSTSPSDGAAVAQSLQSKRTNTSTKRTY
ncbi:hypothetical protein GQ600_1266 [Phytophthora cactorum]|nr:hypothetical protein GQ600_1266 [Phytophthora cactorum]